MTEAGAEGGDWDWTSAAAEGGDGSGSVSGRGTTADLGGEEAAVAIEGPVEAACGGSRSARTAVTN